MTTSNATQPAQTKTAKMSIKVGNIKVGDVYKAKSYNGRTLNLKVVRAEDSRLHDGRFAKLILEDKQGTEYIRYIRHNTSPLGFQVAHRKTYKVYYIPLE